MAEKSTVKTHTKLLMSVKQLIIEWILNGTSAQLGYIVPSTLDIQDRRQIKNYTLQKLNPEKASNAKYSRTKLPGFSRLIQH